MSVIDAADESKISLGKAAPRYTLLKQNLKEENHIMCRNGKYSSCGTYSTGFSKKPAMVLKYDPGPGDRDLDFADRVIIDYVIVSGRYRCLQGFREYFRLPLLTCHIIMQIRRELTRASAMNWAATYRQD